MNGTPSLDDLARELEAQYAALDDAVKTAASLPSGIQLRETDLARFDEAIDRATATTPRPMLPFAIRV